MKRGSPTHGGRWLAQTNYDALMTHHTTENWSHMNFWIVLIALSTYSTHMICYQNHVFRPSAVRLSKKRNFRAAHGDHLGNWRPYWNYQNTQGALVSSFLLSTFWNISHITPSHLLNCLLPFQGRIVNYMIADISHLGNWLPRWNDPNIRIINCLFYMLKTHNSLSFSTI